MSASRQYKPPRFMLFTPREVQVRALVLDGHTSQSIASLLGCSYHTVKQHRKSIRQKERLAKEAHVS